MNIKDMAARAVITAASGILIHAWVPLAAAGDTVAPAVELAGGTGSEADKATPGQLKRAGQPMVPAEGLKKAEPRSTPSAMPMKQAAPAKSATDGDRMPAPAAPAAETKPAPAAETKPAPAAETKPAPAAEPKSAPAAETGPAMMAEPAGVYLRADLGYGFAMAPDGTTSAGAMTGEDVGDGMFVGGGLGYRFGGNLRADLTFDFRPDADVSATTAGGAAVTSEVNGWTVMANGYWDVGTFDAVTPYVGAGIGYARLETSDQVGGTAEPGAISDNFAWAAMLGVSIDLGLPSATVDLGYRFVNLGGFNQSAGADYDELMAHEVRAGLRYRF